MNEPENIPNEPHDIGPPPDGLDELLRAWHQDAAGHAAEARERVLRKLEEAAVSNRAEPHGASRVQRRVSHRRFFTFRRLVMNRYSPIAASIILIAALAWLLAPGATSPALAGNVIMAPDGGRLDALDKEGNVLGPCPLKHTDVAVEVSGLFTRVTLNQLYHNPYKDKIEAVYTFPLSHRAAVDRMKMTVGDRVVIGEVHERARARAIYEAAKQSGYVASLLEQERPNIFTQSVANIESDADVVVEISYVELLQAKDGTYSFEFPMVVGPRYIPGSVPTAATNVPAGLAPRHGLILLCPAKLGIGQQGDVSRLGTLQTGKLQTLLHAAVPIAAPAADWRTHKDAQSNASTKQDSPAVLWYGFEAAYPDGSKEIGTLFADGTGQINGRWFYTDLKVAAGTGAGFAPDTTQVPDASRITPEPVKPGKRAGHDISIRVALDTGGPGIVDLKSALHDIIETKKVQRDDGAPRSLAVELKKEVEIPNRDFVLTWRQTADTIQEATFAHTGKNGKFFTLILQPPARTADAEAVPRELVFVLDTSGSMSGFPIEKAKDVMTKAIGALRPADSFNLITFSGDTRILWDKPRPGSKENIAEAQAFLAGRQGGGGTEMMKAIETALVQAPETARKWLTPEELAALPTDDRECIVRLPADRIVAVFQDGMAPSVADLKLADGGKIRAMISSWMLKSGQLDAVGDCPVEMKGRWGLLDGKRVFRVEHAVCDRELSRRRPIRICCFMTDGYVGNDMQIIDAVKKNAGTTRVFSFGIGNSVNRYLLDGMARAGRGEVEYVLLQSNADEAAKRFAQRIQTPVLTDIELQFSDTLKVTDMIPREIPDLFDVKPLIIHGRYTTPGRGTLTIRGNTGAGRFERAVPIDLPAEQPGHDTIATLWARAKVEWLMNQDLALAQSGNFPAELKQEVINLGEQFGIMTQFTSFVAVEKTRVTVGGQPLLVAVPVEMPAGVSYEGVFGRLSGEETSAAVKAMAITAMAVTPLKPATSEDNPEWTLRTKREIAFDTPMATTAPSPAPTKTPQADRAYRPSTPPSPPPATHALTPPPSPPPPPPPSLVSPTGSGVTVVPLRNAKPEKVEEVLTRLFVAEQEGKGSENIAVGMATVDDKLVVTGNAKDRAIVADLVNSIENAAALAPRPTAAAPAVGFKTETVRVAGEPRQDEELEVLKRRLKGIEPSKHVEVLKAYGIATVDTPDSALLRERVALGIAELVADGKIDEAKKLADQLVGIDANYKIGVQMRDTLADANLAPAERDTRIKALAAEAQKAIEAFLRDAKLRHRLDARLYRYAAAGPGTTKPAGLTFVDGSVRIALLATKLDDATLGAMQRAGLKVEASVKSVKLVVGLAPPERLAGIALLDEVRKVEPAELP